VINKNYQSVKTLLELGADPNMQDLYYGESPLMESVDFDLNGAGSDPRFLKLLLKYDGDPNAEEKGPEKHGRYTPLIFACRTGDLEYVKILVNAGAKINYVNEYGDVALEDALTSVSPSIVIYLLEKGADFKHPLDKTIDGGNIYITDDLRYWCFELGSDAYKKKMQIVDFLKKNGMDYWKTPIPEEYLNDYPKEYLQKY
jgi:hypothetical protein